MSPRIPMPARNIRVSDKLWSAAQATADSRGENLSEQIRRFLEQYAFASEARERPVRYGIGNDVEMPVIKTSSVKVSKVKHVEGGSK